LYRKIKKEIKPTDAQLNQQRGEKRYHYSHFTWQERCVTGDRAATGMIPREDSCGSWWSLRLN